MGGITGGILEDASFVCVRTSGTTIEIATIQTTIVGVRNGLARKYLLGIVKIRASGNIRTLAALKEQIVRAQDLPRRIELAQKKVLKPTGISRMPATIKLKRNGGLIWA